MFSSALAIVLVDCISPAAEEQWGIQEAFSVFDHMMSRGMAPASVYQEHLVEVNNFRMNLRKGELLCKEDPKRQNTPVAFCAANAFAEQNQMEQELICEFRTLPFQNALASFLESSFWKSHANTLRGSWMSMENNDLGALHPDTMQSAILGLNSDSMATTLDIDLDNQWLWGNYTPEHGTG